MHRQRREYPHVYSEIKRGKRVFYFRRERHGERIRLRAPYGSPEFFEEYQAALIGQALPNSHREPGRGTLRWLADQYRQSASWLSLSLSSRKVIGNVIEAALKQEQDHGGVAGELKLSGIKRRHIVDGLTERMATPSAANAWLGAMRALFDHGVLLEAIKANPCDGVKRLRQAKPEDPDEETGNKTWSEEEIAQFEAFYPLGTRERVAEAVMLYTGLRISDAVRIGRQHVRGGVFTITTKKRKVPVSGTIRPELAEALKAGPCGDLVWLVGARGRPITEKFASDWFSKAAIAAGLKDCTAHGLRKAAACRYALEGKTEAELNAIFGWTDPEMAAHYVAAANRQRLAINATARREASLC